MKEEKCITIIAFRKCLHNLFVLDIIKTVSFKLLTFKTVTFLSNHPVVEGDSMRQTLQSN